MKGRSALDRKRDAAFTLEIKSRGQDQATHVVDMIAIGGRMHVFKEDSIFLVQTPDDIDPARTHPETKGSTTQISDIGTRHPLVARTIMQAKTLLTSVVFAENISKEDILNECFQLFKALSICRSIHDNLMAIFMRKIVEVQRVLDESGTNLFVGDVPQMPNMEDQIRNFFLTAHKILKSLIVLTDLFFPTKPKKQNPEKLCEWFLQNLGEGNPMYQMVRDDLDWLVLIWEIRNAIEHPNGKNYTFEVRNIELAPDRNFYAPRWRFRTPGKNQNEFTDLLRDMDTHLNNMVSFAEDLIVLCVREVWSKNLPFVMYKIPQERLDPRCPAQYGVTIDLERLGKPD